MFNVVLFRVIDVTGLGFFATTTLHCAVLPFTDVTVIMAVPSATAVTFPCASTVATLPLEVVHVTSFSVALAGITVAVRFSVSPSTKFSVVLFSDTDVTSMGCTSNSRV